MAARTPELGSRVALISDTTEFAGAELYMVVLVEQLREARSFTALVGDDAAAETRRRLADVGAEVEVVPGLRRKPSPLVVRRLQQAIEALDPAIVHVNLSDQGDGIAALIAAGRIDSPSVSTLNLVLPTRAGWREAISRRLLRRVDTTIGVSDSVGAYLARQEVPFEVVKYGLPPPDPATDPRLTLGLASEDFVVGGIGRLHFQKGWDVLCRAARLVKAKRPEIRFVVIGEGPERTKLEAIPECEHVHFLGRRSQAASLMRAFDLLVVPSRFEGLGLTAVEALYLSVPVVASNVIGLDEALGDCAELVPADDPQALADAILGLAGDDARRASLVERGRERARSLFSVERMAQQTLDVYRSVAAGGAGTSTTVTAMNTPSHDGEARE